MAVFACRHGLFTCQHVNISCDCIETSTNLVYNTDTLEFFLLLPPLDAETIWTLDKESYKNVGWYIFYTSHFSSIPAFVNYLNKTFVFLFTRWLEQYAMCQGSSQTGLRGYNQHNNKPDHDCCWRIWGPRGPRKAQSCALMRWIDQGQLSVQADLLLGGW